MGAGAMYDWKAKLTDEEIEEGLDILERASAKGLIDSNGGRRTFSISCLRDELQDHIRIRDKRRQQLGSNPSEDQV